MTEHLDVHNILSQSAEWSENNEAVSQSFGLATAALELTLSTLGTPGAFYVHQ